MKEVLSSYAPLELEIESAIKEWDGQYHIIVYLKNSYSQSVINKALETYKALGWQVRYEPSDYRNEGSFIELK